MARREGSYGSDSTATSLSVSSASYTASVTAVTVSRGVDEADALGEVEIGVIPVGTGNNFAGNVGIGGIDEAFTVLSEGERRRIDLGEAADRPFVNSYIAGLTADASGETDPELKSKYGVVAYVINTLQSVAEFDGLRIEVDAWSGSESDPAWSGDALCLLVGNGRRFSLRGETQADMEDGHLDVTIVENVPASDSVQEALAERLLGSESASTERMRASQLDIRSLGGERVNFSLDGEMVRDDDTSIRVREAALTVPVGETYAPSPEYDDL